MYPPHFYNQHAADKKKAQELHNAIADGNLRRIKKALKNGASLTWKDDKGINAFFKAVLHGRYDLFVDFKDHEGLKETNKEGQSLIEYAILLGHTPDKLDTLKNAGALELTAVKSTTHHAFHFAVKSGRTRYLDYFLKTNDINLPDSDGLTPLHYACKEGHFDIAHTLLERGANPLARDKQSRTPLYHACMKKGGNKDIVQMLLAIPQVVQTLNWIREKQMNNTPLMMAVENGLYDVVVDMVNKGAHVNAVNKWGEQPLYIAAKRGKADIAKFLIAQGADIAKAKRARPRKLTALHNTSITNYKEIVDTLIKSGAELNAIDKDGKTPLHHVCDFASPEKTSALLSHNPDLECEDYSGYRALDLTLYNGEDDYLVYSSDELNVAIQLLSAGANPNRSDDSILEHAPLHQAIRHNNEILVDTLLKTGADPNDPVQDHEQKYPIHLAAREDRSHLIGLLISHGADITKTDATGKNVLHHAAIHGNGGLIQKCLKKNIFDVDAKTNNGSTVLHIACYHDSLDIVYMLVGAGADIYAHDKFGDTPLHKIALSYNKEVLSYLNSPIFPHKINWNIKNNKTGNSPLHNIVKECTTHDVDTFLKAGCDPLLENKYNLTPLHYAILSGRSDVALKLIQKIVQNEQSFDHLLDARGNTILHYAARMDNYQVMAFLQKTGLDINAQNKFGETPLHIAVRRGNWRLTQWMVKSKQAKTDIQNYAGITPYTLAEKLDNHKMKIMMDFANDQNNPPNTPPNPKGP